MRHLPPLFALLTGLLSLLIGYSAPADAPAFTFVYAYGFAFICFLTVPILARD
jgi:hypothetical protein